MRPPPHKIGGEQQAGRTLINNIRTKYAGAGIGWDEATATRLKQFHYNSTASASKYLGGHGLAFQAQCNSGIYTVSGGFGVLREAVTRTSSSTVSGRTFRAKLGGSLAT